MNLIAQRGQPFEYLEAETQLACFSVTQVRKVAFDTYAGIPEDVLEPARIRGTRLHRRFFFALAALRGLCDYPAVLEDLPGYCASMDDWIAKRRPFAHKMEEPSLSRRDRFAGTPDALLAFEDKPTRLILFDLKTGGRTETDAMQLVAYLHMEGYKANALLDLYLDREGGTAKEVYVQPGEQAIAWVAFKSALNLLKWRTSL